MKSSPRNLTRGTHTPLKEASKCASGKVLLVGVHLEADPYGKTLPLTEVSKEALRRSKSALARCRIKSPKILDRT
jgi:hypothetical protein